MSTYTADLAPAAPPVEIGRIRRRAPLTPTTGGAAVTTYFYRTSGGTRASTTDAGSIPAGAVVERVT